PTWTPPEDLRAVFARQYGALSIDAQHVLQVLSVAGRAMAPLELTNLLGLPGGVVAQASLELLDRGVGRVEEGQLSFKNELHRAYVYYTMGDDRRKYRSEEHTSELQSRGQLVCRLLLEKKNLHVVYLYARLYHTHYTG